MSIVFNYRFISVAISLKAEGEFAFFLSISERVFSIFYWYFNFSRLGKQALISFACFLGTTNCKIFIGETTETQLFAAKFQQISTTFFHSGKSRPSYTIAWFSRNNSLE